jgi:hypothetical protein
VSGALNVDILLHGSSRAQHHFDARVISRLTSKSTYNLGLDGTAIDLQAALFSTYLRHNRKPEYLVLSLDIFTLDKAFDENIYHPGQYVAYLDQPEIFYALKQRCAEWSLYKFCPFVGICRFPSPLTPGNEQLRYEATRGLFKRELPETLVNGFSPVHQKWTSEFNEYKKQHPNGIAYKIRPQNTATLCSILTQCQQLNIQCIFVYSPEYSESQILTINRNEIFNYYRKLATEFSIPFWDYSDTDMSRNKENFYNSQHMNAEGAVRFSEDVATRLLTISRRKPQN